MESDIINELKSHFAAKEYWIEHFKTLWISTLKENEKQAKQIKDLESQLSTKIETDQLICASRLLSEMQVKIVNLEAKLKAKETENHSILKKLEEVSVESKTKIFRIQQENEALKKVINFRDETIKELYKIIEEKKSEPQVLTSYPDKLCWKSKRLFEELENKSHTTFS